MTEEDYKEVIARLEADNAALRSQLEGAISGRDYLLKQANDNITTLEAQIASAEASARLDEAKLWDQELSLHASRDHEYHIGFQANCFECRRQRIAALEKQKAE